MGKYSNIPCSWVEELILLKCPNYPKQSTDSMQFLSMEFFTEIEKKILKFVWSHKRTQINQSIIEKEKQSWKHHTSQFKLYYTTIVIKMVWYWHEKRHIDQWNRIEHPEIKPCMYGQLIFDKPRIFSGKRIVSSVNDSGKMDIYK